MTNTDTPLVIALFSFFLILGAILPFINQGFGQSVSISHDTNVLPSSEQGVGALSFFDVLISMFAVFFWTFGLIPFWIDLIIMLPLRALGVYLAVRFFRGI